MLSFCTFFTGMLLLFFVVDILQRKVITKTKWARRATHIGAGIIIYFMPDYLSRNDIIIMAFVFAALLGVSKWKKILSLHNVDRQTLGEIFYPLGVLCLSIICLPEYVNSFKLGILILAISDAMAGIVGDITKYKRIKVFNNIKSLGGAITFLITTLIILFFVMGITSQTLLVIIGFSLALTFIEFISIFGTDNILLPIMTATIHIYMINAGWIC